MEQLMPILHICRIEGEKVVKELLFCSIEILIFQRGVQYMQD